MGEGVGEGQGGDDWVMCVAFDSHIYFYSTWMDEAWAESV